MTDKNNALQNDISSDDSLKAFEVEMNESNIVNEDELVANAAFMDSFNSGEDLEQKLNEKAFEASGQHNKGEFFKPIIDKYIDNLNAGVKTAINERQYQSEEEVQVAKEYYEKNKKEYQEEYTNYEIANAKLDTMKIGSPAYSPDENGEIKFFSDEYGASDAQFIASETYNDLVSQEGLLNTITSFGSIAFGFRPLAEALTGDTSVSNVKEEIKNYQAITDPKERKAEAARLVEKWWDGTNKNEFTTQFLISQLNNPFYESDLSEDVYNQAFELLALGGGADVISAGKFTKSLGKNSKKGSKNAASLIRQTMKRDPLSSMEQSGNTSGASRLIADLAFKAKSDPQYMGVLTKYSGLDEDTIYQLSTVSNANELDSLFLMNPKLMEKYDTVAEMQAHLRTIKQTTDEINLKEISESDLVNTGVNRTDMDTHTKKEMERIQEKAKAVVDVDTFNKAKDIDVQLQNQENIDVITGRYVDSNNTTAVEKFKQENPDYKVTETVKMDINAVQPLAPMISHKLDLIQGSKIPGSEFLFSPQNRLTLGVDYGKEIGVVSLPSEVTAVRNQAQSFLDVAKPVIGKVMGNINNLPKKDRKLLDEILRQGDEYTEGGLNIGQAYTYRELKNLGANENVIKSYTEYRALADEMFKLNNKIVRDEMEFKGFEQFAFTLSDDIAKQMTNSKSVTYKVVNNEASFYGIKFTSKDKKMEIVNKMAGENVYVEATGEVMSLRNVPEDLLVLNNLVRLNNNVGMDGKPVRFVISNQKGNALPEEVLQYREGFIPRKYEARHYIFRENEYGDAEVVSAVARKSDVEAEIAKLEKQNPEYVGNLSARAEGVDVNTSTGDEFLSEYDVAITSNMSFNTHIRKKELLTTSDGKRVDMKNPFDALSDQVQATVSTRAMSRMRATTLKRLTETIKQVEKARKINILHNPANVLEGIRDELKVEFNEYQQLINYVNKQLVDTTDTGFKSYSRRMRQLVDFIDDKAAKALPEKWNKAIDVAFKNDIVGLHDLEKFDPVRAVKTLNFVRLLGFFDPRQLMLQALQTTAIVSISPKHGAASVMDYMLWKLSKKNFRRDRSVLKDIAAKNGQDVKDLDNMILDLEASNILQSIKMNDDLTLQNYGVFSKSKKAMDTAIEKGMFFYDLGNEMVYSTALLTARREILQGANRRLTQEEMVRALDRANKLAYNFTSANKAGFQDGLTSMATQFMQVPAKAFESLVSSQLTTGEKLRLLAGQGAFFGYTAVPMGEAFIGYLATTLGWTEEEVLAKHQEAIVNFENGFVGMLFSDFFGYEVSTENLQFFGAGVSDVPFYPIVKELMDNNQLMNGSTIIKEALGPSAATLYQGSTILGQAYDVFDTIATEGVSEGYKNARATLFNSQSELSKFFGVTSKFAKAEIIAETGKEVDRFGNVIVHWDKDEKFGRAAGAMFGLNSIDVERAYAKKLERLKLEDEVKYIDTVSEDLYKLYRETKDIKGVKKILYTHCNRLRVSDQTCENIWEKVMIKNINKANELSLETGENMEMVDTLGMFQNRKDVTSNDYKLIELQEKIKRSGEGD